MLPLLACSGADPQPPDSASSPITSAADRGVRCSLNPALSGDPARLRVSGDGAVWILDVVGVLSRYTRIDDEDCTLTGGPIPGATEPFESVNDIAVDPDGELWSLVFFDEARRLGADGVATSTCEVTAGHSLVVGDGQILVWGVGDEVLHVRDDDCVSPGEELPIDRPISPTGRYTSRGLAAASFDAGGALPPGFLIDLGSGAVAIELGTGEAPSGNELAVIADLYVAGNGYLVVDGFSSLWSIDLEGEVMGEADSDALLPLSGDTTESLRSLDYAGSDQYYLASSTFDSRSVWLIDL